jgi:hypothetical protein
MTDAVQTITGCSLGHRSRGYMDYGRFAATFANLDTGRAVRATVKEHFSNESTIEATLNKLARIPDSELMTIQEVTVRIPETDLPGPPQGKPCAPPLGKISWVVGRLTREAESSAALAPVLLTTGRPENKRYHWRDKMDFNKIDWNTMWQEELRHSHWKDNPS